MDDPEFREITEQFVVHLVDKVDEMEAVIESEDFEGLYRLGHWLKGSGGTVGLGRLTQPATDLEVAAKNENKVTAMEQLDHIKQLIATIDLDLNLANE